jgi:hypothetical protein
VGERPLTPQCHRGAAWSASAAAWPTTTQRRETGENAWTNPRRRPHGHGLRGEGWSRVTSHAPGAYRQRHDSYTTQESACTDPEAGARGAGGGAVAAASAATATAAAQVVGTAPDVQLAAAKGMGGQRCVTESPFWQIDHAFPGTPTYDPGLSARESAVCATQHLPFGTI